MRFEKAIVPAVLVAALASGGAASADPTTLTCHMVSNAAYQDEPTTVELNDAQNTVAIHFTVEHLSNPGGITGGADGRGGMPESTVGPLRAMFGNDKITFTNNTPYGSIDGSIDRVTGILDYGNPFQAHWECQVARKQF